MKLVKTTLDISMKSEEAVDLGVWQGAKIRSALVSAVARRYCDNLRYENCDKCNIDTCMNKYLFNFKVDNKARMASNPIVVDCSFDSEDRKSDSFAFKLHLFDPATEYIDDIVEILENGIHLGSPRVKFIANKIDTIESEIDISGLDGEAQGKSNCILEVNFETPFVTNGKSGVTPQQIIRSCTTRITSMVNTAGIEYRVPYDKVNEAAGKIELIKCDLDNTYNTKKSSRKKRYDNIHGVTGSIQLKGDFTNIYEFMQVASKLNIGKQCTMGFGKFTVVEVEQ